MDIVGRFEDVFCNAAIAKGDGTSEEDSKLFAAMHDSFTRLYNHPSGGKHILQLLLHENNWVKIWVATQILSESSSPEAEKVLKQLALESGVFGFNAEIVLNQYENGELKCPFDINP